MIKQTEPVQVTQLDAKAVAKHIKYWWGCSHFDLVKTLEAWKPAQPSASPVATARCTACGHPPLCEQSLPHHGECVCHICLAPVAPAPAWVHGIHGEIEPAHVSVAPVATGEPQIQSSGPSGNAQDSVASDSAVLKTATQCAPTEDVAPKRNWVATGETAQEMEFNRKERLAPANRLVDGIDPENLSKKFMYLQPGETMQNGNVGAWYHNAVYWKHRALAAQPAGTPEQVPLERKMLTELKRLLSNGDLIIKAPSRQWSAEWAAVTDALYDWDSATPPPREREGQGAEMNYKTIVMDWWRNGKEAAQPETLISALNYASVTQIERPDEVAPLVRELILHYDEWVASDDSDFGSGNVDKAVEDLRAALRRPPAGLPSEEK